jgi:hypothetical protein
MSLSIDRFVRFVGVISAVYAICVGAQGSARADGIGLPRAAAGYCDTIRLLCENSRVYGLCPIAVTDVGELVTANLTSPGPHKVRAIPMGNGYRYAGRGIWFDGKGSEGRLYFGHRRSVACTVAW